MQEAYAGISDKEYIQQKSSAYVWVSHLVVLVLWEGTYFVSRAW